MCAILIAAGTRPRITHEPSVELSAIRPPAVMPKLTPPEPREAELSSFQPESAARLEAYEASQNLPVTTFLCKTSR